MPRRPARIPLGRRLPVLAVLLFAALLLCPPQAPARSQDEQFNAAWNAFQVLSRDPVKGASRAEWEKVERSFLALYKGNPSGPYAPKVLYYLGRIFEELGDNTGQATDHHRAVDYFTRMATRFPDHAWADDALLRRAAIRAERLDQKDLAEEDLQSILRSHPDSDMAGKAKILLTRLQTKAAAARTPQPAKAADPRPEPRPEARPEPRPEARPAPEAAPDRPRITAIRSKNSRDYARVVLDLDDEAAYRIQSSPAEGGATRLTVDLDRTRLKESVPADQKPGDGLLRRIEASPRGDGVRITLEFAGLKDHKSFVLPSPSRVVIDAFAASPEEEAQAKSPPQAEARDKAAPDPPARAEAPSAPEPAEKPDFKPGKGVNLKGGKKAAGDLLEQLGLTVQTIMIDAGHGGKDPGAQANGISEKDLNLHVARMLGDRLREKGLQVAFTRETDVFIPLEERTAMANARKADMFVSIHCNAHPDPSVHGLETYSLNMARTKDAVRVAARENAVSSKHISDLQVILTDLMLNSKVKESRDLALQIQDNALDQVRPRWRLRDQGVREAPFYVLMGAKMPSILVEIGYITNPAEAERLSSDTYLQALTRGVADGIFAYKKRIERYAVQTPKKRK